MSDSLVVWIGLWLCFSVVSYLCVFTMLYDCLQQCSMGGWLSSEQSSEKQAADQSSVTVVSVVCSYQYSRALKLAKL